MKWRTHWSFKIMTTTTTFALFGRNTTRAFAPTLSQKREAIATKLKRRQYSTHQNHQQYGSDMDQEAMMESDRLIAVTSNDRLIDPPVNLSKRQGHTFTQETPRALLHRAFSFFLFDAEGKMLLTQRAKSKITFPGVWTNTCCSHPLYGMIPSEVDSDSGSYPHFPGIKHAAVRKLRHELGINLNCNPETDFQFITRFHYWAADTVTYGTEDPKWGEHEIDYILFHQSKEEVRVEPNPDEVATYKYVSVQQLQEMMNESSEKGILWSPWFRGIMDRGGWKWWQDLEGSLAGKYTNENVVFFDPPQEHFAQFNLETHDRETGVLKMQSAAKQ